MYMYKRACRYGVGYHMVIVKETSCDSAKVHFVLYYPVITCSLRTCIYVCTRFVVRVHTQNNTPVDEYAYTNTCTCMMNVCYGKGVTNVCPYMCMTECSVLSFFC